MGIIFLSLHNMFGGDFMICNSSALRERDVINLCDGRRLGYICDFSVDTDCGKICAIYVSNNFFGFGGQKNVLKIGWECISCIGEDTILVRVTEEIKCCDNDCVDRKRKRGLWG